MQLPRLVNVFLFVIGWPLFAPTGVALAQWQSCVIGDQSLVVDVNDCSSRPINRRLFGCFSEHVYENVYGGLWAEIIRNPGMDRFRDVVKRPDYVLDRMRETGDLNQLHAITRDAAFHWEPYGETYNAAYEFSETLPVSPPHAQVCRLRWKSKEWTGVSQVFKLPIERCRSFQLTLHLRSEQTTGRPHQTPVCIRVLDESNGSVIFEQVVDNLDRQWSRLDYRFKVEESEGREFRLLIGAKVPIAFAVDSVSLMPTDHQRGWDPVAITEIREARIPLMRFPGGNFVSGYRWRLGTGKRLRRTTVRNPAWNGVVESNHVGIDEWMDFMSLTGCEPLLCINAGDGTIDEAIAWLEYCNGDATTAMGRLRIRNGHREPYGIRIVEIGNELYGSWQIGHCDAKEYARRYQAFYNALNSRFPEVRFIANGGPKFDPSWNEELLAVGGDDVSSVSLHYLFDMDAAAGYSPSEYYKLAMAHASGFDNVLAKHRTQFLSHQSDAKLALTELMLFHQRSDETHPMSKHLPQALWYSGVIHACLRNDDFVDVVTQSATMNHGGSMQKEDARIYKTPGWLAYVLYCTAEGDRQCKVDLSTPTFDVPAGYGPVPQRESPMLDAFALTNGEKDVLTLFIANRSETEDLRLPIEIKSQQCSSVVLHRIAGESIMDRNTLKRPDKISVVTTTVEPSSLDAMTFPKLSLSRITIKLRSAAR